MKSSNQSNNKENKITNATGINAEYGSTAATKGITFKIAMPKK